MPARSPLDAILPPEGSAGELERRLWQRLRPQAWPIPPGALPQGTALVGGAVRDALLGRLAEHPDLDLVVPAGAVTLGRRLADQLGGTCVVLDAGRDIARVVVGGWTIDLARQEGQALSDDLGRRDFSANAIALPLAAGSRLLDPTGGLAALRRGQLVAVSEGNLLDDPLRLLRGIRLRWELELELETGTRAWIGAHAALLGTVAGERVLSELQRLAAAGEGQRGLAQALELGLLNPWGADREAAGRLALLDREAPERLGLSAVEGEVALPLARLAALLPAAAVAALRGSRRLQRQCEGLRRWWQRLHDLAAPAGQELDALPETERLELHRDLEATLPALLLALPAAGTSGALARWRDGEDPLFHPRPPLDGDRLRLALNLPAGPELGALLRHLTRERAFGRLGAADAEATLAAARRWLDERRG
ncbi:CCA tRNA nucleotidyltransferase [Cyanobium sp. CH-040]|uniref:CCA tRNA nucleotidyltransferase n=1 Tax=Cyanobium sp. CH-040 TaxID=2823708 RepID=UPI0020CBE3C5|nr:CCA tRNA nucleotidyltransferase [Cyanobium sp. CH-040]